MRITQNAWHLTGLELSFWEVMDYFVLLDASLAASKTLLQWLLSCLNFTLEAEDLSFWYKWKQWFLWTMEMSKAWPDIFYEGYIHQFQPEPTNKTHHHQQKYQAFKDLLPWNISQLITKTIPISRRTRTVISYAIKWDIPLWIWWKVNENWDNMIRIFQWRESHCRKKY